MLRTTTKTALVLALVALSLPAQVLTASVEQAQLGSGVMVTLTAPETGATLLDGCVIDLIAQEIATGPIVYQPQFCHDGITFLAGGEKISEWWDLRDQAGNYVAPGTYWLWANWQDHRGVGRVAQVAVEVVNRVELHQLTSSDLGARTRFMLDAPAYAHQAYLVAVSGSTNRGFWVGGFHAALDQDGLFWFSLMEKNHVFENFQGALSAEGHAWGIAANIPDNPSLSGFAVHMQAMVRDWEEPIVYALSTPLTVWIDA